MEDLIAKISNGKVLSPQEGELFESLFHAL